MEDDKQNAAPNEPISELERLQKQNEEYLNGWKRAKADYINLKKESDQRQKELLQMAAAGMVLNLLPIYENLKKAERFIPEEQRKERWVEGVVNIKKQFEDFFRQLRIEEIKTVGEKFDPLRHEAVGKRAVEGLERDTIVEEAQTGFLSEGKVLVPAKVVVSE